MPRSPAQLRLPQGLPAWLPLLVGALLRLVQLPMPVVGVHSWRQADTAAMARHFAENGMVLWLPQIDWGGASPGYVESEFPLYPFLLAGLHQLFGVHDQLGRLLSLLFSLLTILLVQRIGQRLLGAGAGRWGALLFAVSPSAVYFGRAVQAEALLLLAAAVALDRLIAWLERQRPADLLLSWLAFSGCCLLKVLPLVWLGLPLAWLWQRRRGWRGLLARPAPWLYALGAIALVAAWYWHAHRLGQSSGLSFGFWGGQTNRYSWRALLGPAYWSGLALRISLRDLALFGVPLLGLGLRELWLGRRQLPNRSGSQGDLAGVLPLGAAAVLLAGALAPESSAVHEYYQLPLMLFLSPLMGLGMVSLLQAGRRRLSALLLGLLLLTSLTILSLDYWRVEARQARDLLPLALEIRHSTPADAPIVAVTGKDPTLLNLARRRGWLVRPKRVSVASMEAWRAQGASALVGHFDRIESFATQTDEAAIRRLQATLCALHQEAAWRCSWSGNGYLVPLQPGFRP
ncbi:MAG: glycosyltransferase family 39 protein [Synechococcaceae cyanobacterium]|nr:glycosyltransferase family 39 protein [Synechococcaceae cyanobacterium]